MLKRFYNRKLALRYSSRRIDCSLVYSMLAIMLCGSNVSNRDQRGMLSVVHGSSCSKIGMDGTFCYVYSTCIYVRKVSVR